MAVHLIANLSWQSDYWCKEPKEQDFHLSRHGDPKKNGALWESRNFNFEERIRDGRKLGFLVCQSPPLSFTNGEGIVFFASRRYEQRAASRGYIVGLYALPKIVRVDWDQFEEFSDDASNISASLEMCVRWKSIDRVPIDKSRYFAGRKTIRKFIYIGDREAKAIVRDAITKHRDGPNIQQTLRTVAKSVWGENVKL